MTVDWQTIVAVGIVALSASIVISRFYRYLTKPDDGKIGCSHCPSGGCSSVKSTPLVQLTKKGKLN